MIERDETGVLESRMKGMPSLFCFNLIGERPSVMKKPAEMFW